MSVDHGKRILLRAGNDPISTTDLMNQIIVEAVATESNGSNRGIQTRAIVLEVSNSQAGNKYKSLKKRWGMRLQAVVSLEHI